MRKTLKNWLPSESRLRRRGGRSGWSGWLLGRKGLWSTHRRALAGGIAIGLFIGLTPTVGFQTPLVLLGAFAFRVSFPASFLALWISNPLTTPVLYWLFNRLGAHILGSHFPMEALTGLAPFAQMLIQQSTYLWLGSLLLAIPGAVLGYLGFIWAWRLGTVRRWRQRRIARRMAAEAAL